MSNCVFSPDGEHYFEDGVLVTDEQRIEAYKGFGKWLLLQNTEEKALQNSNTLSLVKPDKK